MNKIKIGIVDDHQAIAKGISSELSSTGQCEVLFITSEKEEIQNALKKNLPDILIMDVVMPGTQGIETFKSVLAAYPSLKILAYTALNSPLLIKLLLKAGVKGYVGKNQTLPDLKEAVSDVFYDRISLPTDYNFLRKKLLLKEPTEELSKREIDILTLIAAEKKTHEIAEIFQISVNTVETHRKNLFDKLHVSNLAGLIKAGFDMGYIK